MTKFTIIPILVKVLEIWHTPYGYSETKKRVTGHTLHIGTYYVAEHSKTSGLATGDKFIIKEHLSTMR